MVSLRNLSCCLIGVLVISLATSDLQAQRGGNRGGGRFGQGGFGGGFGGFGGGSLALLAREDVQKELELLDDQIEEIEAARDDQQASIREAFSGFGRGGNRGRGGDRGRDRNADKGKKGGGEDRFARFREMREKMEKETQKALDEILLPHQSKRLNQLVLQRSLRGGASQVAAALSRGDLAEGLNVTEKQGESLQAKARTIETKLQAQIAKLRQQAQEELLKSLSPEQQREFKDMVGKPFTFTEPERGRGGRGQRGGRGRGGERGGRSERPRRPNDA